MSRRNPPTQYGRLTLGKVEELADKASEIGRWTMWSVYRLARTRSRRQSLKMASRLRYRVAADRIFAGLSDEDRAELTAAGKSPAHFAAEIKAKGSPQ